MRRSSFTLTASSPRTLLEVWTLGCFVDHFRLPSSTVPGRNLRWDSVLLVDLALRAKVSSFQTVDMSALLSLINFVEICQQFSPNKEGTYESKSSSRETVHCVQTVILKNIWTARRSWFPPTFVKKASKADVLAYKAKQMSNWDEGVFESLHFTCNAHALYLCVLIIITSRLGHIQVKWGYIWWRF